MHPLVYYIEDIFSLSETSASINNQLQNKFNELKKKRQQQQQQGTWLIKYIKMIKAINLRRQICKINIGSSIILSLNWKTAATIFKHKKRSILVHVNNHGKLKIPFSKVKGISTFTHHLNIICGYKAKAFIDIKSDFQCKKCKNLNNDNLTMCHICIHHALST